MNNPERIEIPLDKRKLYLRLIGTIIFVAISIRIIYKAMNPPAEGYSNSIYPISLGIIGVIGILFFGVLMFYFIKRLIDKSPGLVISDKGIFDYSSGMSSGFIPWSDVIDIRERVSSINIIVKNPQDYLAKQKNVLKRKLMQLNHKYFGILIGIPDNVLKYKYSELKNLLATKFKENKS